MPMEKPSPKPCGIHVLFLDGECLLCQRSARLLHHIDRSGKMHFSPLQGATAAILPQEWKQLTDSDGHAAGSAVLVENLNQQNERRWRGADALLRSLWLTRSVFSLCWPAHLLPRFFKQGIYKLLAKNRYRLTESQKTCPVPDMPFKDRILP